MSRVIREGASALATALFVASALSCATAYALMPRDWVPPALGLACLGATVAVRSRSTRKGRHGPWTRAWPAAVAVIVALAVFAPVVRAYRSRQLFYEDVARMLPASSNLLLFALPDPVRQRIEDVLGDRYTVVETPAELRRALRTGPAESFVLLGDPPASGVALACTESVLRARISAGSRSLELRSVRPSPRRECAT